MEQEHRERKKRAKIFLVAEILWLLFVMVMVGVFARASSWRPVLIFSVLCFVIFLINIYIGFRWYSRITK